MSGNPASRIGPLIDRILPDAVALRHELHAHPETALEESETRARLRNFLGDGFRYREPLLGTDLIAELPGVSPLCVALRADMDALALNEESGVPWSSENPGRMHACGHDGHMAVLAGAARVLAMTGTPPPLTVRFVFQPGEEVVGAGRHLADRGAYDGAVSAYALHGWPGIPLGSAALKEGAYFGASHNFRAVFRGRGGHGAYPERSVNPLPSAARALLALQSLHQEVCGAGEEVVTPCSLTGGHAANVIPDQAVLLGTVRYLQDGRGGFLEKRVKELIEEAASEPGITVELNYEKAYEVPVVNDPGRCALVRKAAASAVPAIPVIEETGVERGSEDFAFALRRVPGCLFKLGIGTGAPALHSSGFDFTDAALRTGIQMMVILALTGGSS